MAISLTWASGIFCFIAGVLVGIVYFGGLWWTVKHLQGTESMTRLLVASWLVRNAFFLGVFFWIMQGNWQRLLAAFAGMVSVRIAMTVYMRIKNGKTAAEAEK